MLEENDFWYGRKLKKSLFILAKYYTPKPIKMVIKGKFRSQNIIKSLKYVVLNAKLWCEILS